MNAPAIYLGLQPGFKHLPPIELYNLLIPVGRHPVGSTVSRKTLEAHGFMPSSFAHAMPNQSKSNNRSA
ncbi:MAG: hypothetical protein IPP19_14620 [Verrucomicrobia bacterium]|nr:hypothetical protein [Verrucomicrobiota bacterium]